MRSRVRCSGVVVRVGLLVACVGGFVACSYRSQVLSPYGSRVGVRRAESGAALGRRAPHRGVDLGKMSLGDPVLAAAPGIVLSVTTRRNAGTEVVIVHDGLDDGFYATSYLHLATSVVAPGEVVARG